MRSIVRSAVVVAVVGALLASGVAPAAWADVDRPTVSAPAPATPPIDGSGSLVPTALPDSAAATGSEGIPALRPPEHLDARLGRVADEWVVTATTRIARHAGVSASRLPDRVSAVVSVRDPRTGRLLHGPVFAGETGWALAATGISLTGATGVVQMRIPLTAGQAAALERTRRAQGPEAAAAAVRVRLVHAADLSIQRPGRESLGVIEARTTSAGPALVEPPRLMRASNQAVTVINSTSNPVILLSGPAQCIYDNYYASTQRTNQQSFLGAMNGAILPAGSSISVAIQKDDEDLDGKNNDFNYTQVLDDYQQALADSFVWLQQAGVTTLPQMGFAYTPDNPMGLPYELWQSIGLFIGHILLDGLSAYGMWSKTVAALAASFPEDADTIEAYADAFEPYVDGGLAVFEVAIAIIEGLITLFTDGCNSNPGYFIVGATDLYHPWRSFAQVYNWNGGSIEVAYQTQKGKKTYFSPYANGMIVQSLPPSPLPEPGVIANALDGVFMPGGFKGAPVFEFREPPNQAVMPASITVDKGTRTVSCGLAASDQEALQANLASQMSQGTSEYLIDYPTSIWAGLTTDTFSGSAPSSPGYPYDYFVGYRYLPPAAVPTARVYWSPDGQSFENYVDIPPGASSVAIPTAQESGAAAALVTCVVQAPEMWNIGQSPLPTSRALLMGTLVPSDVMQGPDYPSGG